MDETLTNHGDDINTKINSSIVDAIPATISNIDAGYEAPVDVKLNPLLSIPEVESFDYESALKAGLSPTDILDNMQQMPEFNKDFDFTAARSELSDDILVANMAQDSEKSKINLARSKAYHAGIDNDFTLGALHAAAGINALAEDLKFWKSDEEQEKAIQEVQSFAKDLSRARNDKDFFSLFTAGDITAQIATLPLAAQSRLATGAIEGVLGYASGRAEGTQGEAAVDGAISGTVGAGIAHLLRGVNGSVAKETLEKFKDNHLTTDDAVTAFQKYKKEWDKVIDVDVARPSIVPFTSKEFSVNPNNPAFYKINDEAAKETAVLVDFLKGPGAEFKQEASALSLKAEKSIRNIKQQRVDSVNNILNTVDLPHLDEVSTALKKGIETITTDFGKVKDSIGIVPVDNKDLTSITSEFSEEALTRLDEALRPDIRTLKDLIEDNTVNSLMDANILINSIIRKTSKKGKTKKFKLNKLKDSINSKIRDAIPKAKYMEYQAMNRDYAKMAGIRDSKINEALQAAAKGDITAEDALRLVNKTTGKNLFNDIDWLIGTAQATKLELLTMKDAFRNSTSNSWAQLGKQIDGKGFATPEGKAFRDTVQKFSELFDIDDLVVDGLNKGGLLQGGAKSDAASQIKGAFFRSAWLSLQKHIPFLEVGKRAEELSGVIDTLKNPQKLKDFVTKVEGISKPVAHREIQRLMKELPQFPEPRLGGIPNIGKPLNPVFDSMVKTEAIQDGLEEAFKDAMFSKLRHSESNAIIDGAFKHFDGTRFPTKIAKIAKLMKEDKVAHNTKLFDAAIKGEAELMAKAIAKDHGVKVDKEMMESLIEYITEKSLKDCN